MKNQNISLNAYVPRHLFGARKERDALVENLSLLLASGVSIDRSLQTIEKEVRSSQLKGIIQNIREEIERGSSLWKAFARSRILPVHLLALLKAGESGGRLAENLRLIARQQQRDASLHSKIRSALIYPVLIVVTALIVSIGVGWFVLPRLATVFSSMGVDLPLPSRVLIAVGTFMKEHGLLFVVGLLFVTVALLSVLFFSTALRRWLFSTVSRVPGLRTVSMQLEIARLGHVASTLLKAGIPVAEMLHSLEQATTDKRFKRLYKNLRQDIESGKSFETGFEEVKNADVIPIAVRDMVIAAEQSGRLPESFQLIGERYEEKLDLSTKNLATVIEPILLVVVAVLVMGVALAVVLPIYSLIGNLEA